MLKLDLDVTVYVPLWGSSYIKLPKYLEDKKAVLNIKNDDQKCFVWSVLAALHPIGRKKTTRQFVHHYRCFEQELNVNDITFPMRVCDIAKFERQNPTISINLYGFEERELFPIYITECKREKHVNLLLISNSETMHYCLITNLNRFLSSLTKHNGKMFYCNYCLHGFFREDLLIEHEPLCSKNGPQKIRMPTEGSDLLYFNDVRKQLKVPFVIYVDFESILVPCEGERLNEHVSYTQKTHNHKASGFCYIVVSDVEDFNTPPMVYRGEDAVEKFLECLLMEEKRITSILKYIVPINLSVLDEHNFQEATHCHICGEELDQDRVRPLSFNREVLWGGA